MTTPNSAHRPADCIFCRIVAGTAPAEIVHEDESSIAFLDIRPSAPGHTLVISKEHHENLFEASPAALAGVGRATQRVALGIRQALNPDGLRVAQFNGAAAGQTVFHFHVHLVPVSAGQPRGIHGRSAVSPEELQAVAARIREALA